MNSFSIFQLFRNKTIWIIWIYRRWKMVKHHFKYLRIYCKYMLINY